MRRLTNTANVCVIGTDPSQLRSSPTDQVRVGHSEFDPSEHIYITFRVIQVERSVNMRDASSCTNDNN